MSFVALACRDNAADYLERAAKEQSPMLRAMFEILASKWHAKAQEWEKQFYQTNQEEAR